MLDYHPRRQLCSIIAQYGQAITTEPKRCRGLLNDLAPQYRLENNLLIMALEQDVAEQLLKPSGLMPIESQLERLAQVLHNAVGIEEELAYWAVESWALALCVISEPIPRVIQPKPPESLHKPFAVHNAKKTRQMTFVVFFTAWMVAGIFVATVFDLSSKPKQVHNVTKPLAVKQAVVDIPKNTQDQASSEQYDGWTANNLGDMYFYAHGAPKNDQKAAEWYRKSAEQGYAVGQCNLGFMYTQGYGVPQDYQQAAEWYRKAAEQGNADGENNLATLYENGYGVNKDMEKALEWYTKAVEQGHYGAQQSLKRLVDKS